MTWDELKGKLDEEKEKTGGLPQFWDPIEEEKLMGQITEKRTSNFDESNYLYHVKDPETGKERTTPEHTTLMSGLKRKQANVGDYVLIEFQGTEKSQSSGRDVYMYEISVIPEEKAEEILGTEMKKQENGDEDYDKIKEVLDFFDEEVDKDEFESLCSKKNIDEPLEKEYINVEDGKVTLSG